MELPVTLTSSMDVEVAVSWHTAGQPGPGGPDLPASNGARGSSGPSVQDVPSLEHEHEPSSGTVTFQPGDTKASISITIMDDEEHEDLESFQIELGEVTVPSSNLVEIDERMAQVSIRDDDAPPVFTEGNNAVRSRGGEHAGGPGHRRTHHSDRCGRRPAELHPERGRRRLFHPGQRHRPTPHQRTAGL